MPRSHREKVQHDTMVKRIAHQYERKGYDVEADVKGYEQPETVRGVRPDLKLKKGSHTTLVEVETPSSVDTKRDLEQQKAFKNWSKDSDTKHFRRVLTEE